MFSSLHRAHDPSAQRLESFCTWSRCRQLRQVVSAGRRQPLAVFCQTEEDRAPCSRAFWAVHRRDPIYKIQQVETRIVDPYRTHSVCRTRIGGRRLLFSLERTQPTSVRKYTGKAGRGFSLRIENVQAKYPRTEKSHTSPIAVFSVYHLGTLDPPTTRGAFSASLQTLDCLPQACTQTAKARRGLSVCSTEWAKLCPQKRDGEAFLSGQS